MFKRMILFLFILILCLLNASLANSNPIDIAEQNIIIPIKDNLKLDGKITYPKSSQKTFPAVLLLHGSGQLDMDMTIKSTILTPTYTGKEIKPLRDIAEYLSSYGFLVLRYNKRSYQYSKIAKNITWENVLDDAESGINFLKSLSCVNKNKIFILGISQGSVIGSNLAIKEKDIAGLILMSTLAGDFRDALRYQSVERTIDWLTPYDINKDGKFSKEEIKNLPTEYLSLPMEICDINKDGFIDRFELRALLEIQFYNDVVISKMYQEDNLSLVMKIIDQISVPILFLHGEKDEQTPLFELYSLIFILEQNKNSNFQYKIFPGVGHGFSPPKKEGKFEKLTVGPIQKDVLEYLCQWLKSKV